MNSARLLKIIFVILLMVIMGELFYYLCISNLGGSQARRQINIPISKRVSPAASTVSNFNCSPGRLISEDLVNYVYNCKSIPTCVKGWFIINIEGKVKEIKEKEGRVDSLKFKPYEIKLYKEDSTTTYSDMVRLNLAKTVIKDREGKLITKDQIKIGDLVKIEIKYDYVSNEYFYELRKF